MLKRSGSVFLAMLPIGAFAGLLIAALSTFLMPRIYESEAVIEVRPLYMLSNGFSSPEKETEIPPWLGMEIETISSQPMLEKTSDHLELSKRWNLPKNQVAAVLKKNLTVQPIRETDLVSIRVRHTNKVDARDIAMEVVQVYKNYRKEIDQREKEMGLVELEKAVRYQEDKLEERRKVLATIVRIKRINVKVGSSLAKEIGMDQEQIANETNLTVRQLEQEKMQLEGQISSLLKYDGDQLMVYIHGLSLSENRIKNLYPQYLEAKRQLEILKINGLGDSHPTVHAMVEQISSMKKELDEGIVNLRYALKTQLDKANQRLIETRGETGKNAKPSGFDAQDYVNAKRDFETDQQLLETMKRKQMGDTIALKLPTDIVEIHEFPIIADTPVSPNVTFNLVFGTVLGFLLVPLMALPVMRFFASCAPV